MYMVFFIEQSRIKELSAGKKKKKDAAHETRLKMNNWLMANP